METLFLDTSGSNVVHYPLPDERSLLELAGHLRDHERIMASQLEQLVRERSPILRLHDLEWLEPERHYRKREFSRLVFEFLAMRQRTYRILRQILPRAGERTAQHPFLGRVSVRQLAERLHQHDLDHLWQVRRLHDALELETAQRGGSAAHT